MKKGVELIQKLALAFGPTSFEGDVVRAIREEIDELGLETAEDWMGNLTVHVPGPEGAPRIMLSAHTDEVGFMITEIEDEGYIRFKNLGGIEKSVLVGRHVTLGNEERKIPGVIAARGIHVQSAEERKKLPEQKELYIDIGTKSREETEKLVQCGDYGVFCTPCLSLGEGGSHIAAKALDDRLGCAVLIEVLREISTAQLPLDLWFCFTVREEIGRSGATVTANRIAPDVAIVLETTAIADLADVPPARRVAEVGKGGVLSLLDRATIYDRGLVDFALDTAKKHGIAVQIKQFVSGGNDAGNIQKTNAGVRCMALSAPVRYLHAPMTVAAIHDYNAMVALVGAMLNDWEKGE